MFRSIKRLLFAATLILAVSAPSAAYALVRGTSGGPATSGQPQLSSVPRASVSSSQGFRWGDAGIGAIGVLVLVGVGSGAALIIRRGAHHPLAS